MTTRFFPYICASLVICIVGLGVLSLIKKTPSPANPPKMTAAPKPPQQKSVRIVAVREKAVAKNKKAKSSKRKIKRSSPKPATQLKRHQGRPKPKAAAKPVRPTQSALQRSERPTKRLASANLKVNHQIVEDGRKVIDSRNAVPVVLAQYDRIGFDTYLQKMKEMGGRVYIGDVHRRKIIAEVILSRSMGRFTFSGFDSGNLHHLQELALFRPREIAGEQVVFDTLYQAQRFFSFIDLRCVVLLPVDREAAFLGALKQYLRGTGFDISEFDYFWGQYVIRNSQFGLEITKGRLRNSSEEVEFTLMVSM